MRKYLSMGLKFVIFFASIIGVILSVIMTSKYQSGLKSLMYFTVQSNLWIGFTSLWILVLMILEEVSRNKFIRKYHYALKYIFTVSISLTGLVFCAFLAPNANNYNPWALNSILTHVVVPVISIIDFFVDDYKFKLKNKDILYTLLPPLYYFLFSLMCFIFDFKFSDGNNYPYFFLNFNSIIWTYWIVILALIVSIFGYLFKVLNNTLNNNRNI
jgi:hypothetical protein